MKAVGLVHGEPHLPAGESPAAAKFEQRVLQAVHQRLVQIVLGEMFA